MVVAVADAEKTREAVSALKSIDPRTLDQDPWREVSMSAKVAGIPYEDWDAWCRLDLEHYDERKNRQRWESFCYSNPEHLAIIKDVIPPHSFRAFKID